MSSLIAKLQSDILSGSKTVTEILRTAKLISAKLGLTDIEEWIGCELNGYATTGNVPEYRVATGTLQARNPYHGWITATGGGTEMKFSNPVAAIEEYAKQDSVAFAPTTQIQLSAYDRGMDGLIMQFPQRVVFSGIAFKSMIEAVRDRLLDWSLELEKRGITGENMSFDETEKKKAHNQTFNIQNFTGVLGDVSHSNVNVYDYSSIHQELKQRGIPQAERNELENILDELKRTEPKQKETWKDKGKAWILRNQELLGAGANIVRQALGIPDVA